MQFNLVGRAWIPLSRSKGKSEPHDEYHKGDFRIRLSEE